MKSRKEHFIYNLRKLIDGEVVGLSGWYAAVPDKGFKGHPFKIVHLRTTKDESGEPHYRLMELEVKDWNKAEAFRKEVNIYEGGGFFTLGYFKLADYGTI